MMFLLTQKIIEIPDESHAFGWIIVLVILFFVVYLIDRAMRYAFRNDTPKTREEEGVGYATFEIKTFKIDLEKRTISPEGTFEIVEVVETFDDKILFLKLIGKCPNETFFELTDELPEGAKVEVYLKTVEEEK